MGSIEAVTVREVSKQVSVLPEDPVIIIGGADIIAEYNKKLDRAIKIYNRRLEKLSSPYFLRTKHKVGEYEYAGRYFYKHIWDEDSGKLKEIYVGLTVPDDEQVPEGGFPPSPTNDLEGFQYRTIYHDIICSRDMFDEFYEFFKGKKIIVLRLRIP
ncbi:MAG: hypothetical protein PVG65_03360 [Candidatus Thorarchaeota archaeon]